MMLYIARDDWSWFYVKDQQRSLSLSGRAYRTARYIKAEQAGI